MPLGFSLDFVPHVQAGKVRWHRTERSASIDIPDPVGASLPDVPRWGSVEEELRGGHETFDAAVVRVVPLALAAISDVLSTVQSEAALRAWVNERLSPADIALWTQCRIALAMLTARAGDGASARRLLEQYYHYEYGSPDLRSLLETIVASAVEA